MASMMTTREVAAYLKLHKFTIWKYASGGVIPSLRIGRIWRFDKDKIDEWISSGTGAQKEERISSNGKQRTARSKKRK